MHSMPWCRKKCLFLCSVTFLYIHIYTDYNLITITIWISEKWIKQINHNPSMGKQSIYIYTTIYTTIYIYYVYDNIVELCIIMCIYIYISIGIPLIECLGPMPGAGY